MSRGLAPRLATGNRLFFSLSSKEYDFAGREGALERELLLVQQQMERGMRLAKTATPP